MNIQDAALLISGFSQTGQFKACTDNKGECEVLEAERGVVFPPELKEYINTVCPTKHVALESVGYPVDILSKEELSWTMPGFNVNAVTGKAISSWDESWFLIANEGGEPIIVKLNEHERSSVVYSALQGAGPWEFCPIADSIGQFLVCAAAIEHALNFPGVDEPLDEDFNLAKEAAQWLFPFIREHAEAYYDEWLSVFENYLDDV
ncbi:SMI1/KNR4 family protein [Alkalimarinus sediminis]|uniref:SMI1/KNR4 family protein n=1 Tax=Alkalimarinus sediminis TaxID=1632866 RepID=A0A9E8HN27_9ALTE|nr:SMI1/KNR4 family protein [Alkalimarinus sediminis]UZW73301.1 SMI1/KNR4 family protein [Alkalimarinus sediminis]